MKHQHPTVPKKYANKWIAWNKEQTKIVASGRTLPEAREAATVAGEERAVFAKMPPGLFVG